MKTDEYLELTRIYSNLKEWFMQDYMMKYNYPPAMRDFCKFLIEKKMEFDI